MCQMIVYSEILFFFEKLTFDRNMHPEKKQVKHLVEEIQMANTHKNSTPHRHVGPIWALSNVPSLGRAFLRATPLAPAACSLIF